MSEFAVEHAVASAAVLTATGLLALSVGVAVGQRAEVDTQNGVIEGNFSRIDPAVIEETVLVDIRLLAGLPRGTRPDLSMDGTIERLEDVLHVGRPIQAREDSKLGLLRLEGDRTHAPRVQVQVGKVSVSTIEIRTGLGEGDAVVLSDTSARGACERIRLGVIHQPLPVRMVAAAHTAWP